jgi:hypothetical protein
VETGPVSGLFAVGIIADFAGEEAMVDAAGEDDIGVLEIRSLTFMVCGAAPAGAVTGVTTRAAEDDIGVADTADIG